MRLLLDTNRYRDLVDRDLNVTERVEQSASTWLSAITIGELRAGFATGRKQLQNESRLQAVLSLQGVGILPVDEETTYLYAQVYRDLKRKGRPIPRNDLWIAAQALQYNLVLDTRDRHFNEIPGLSLVGN